MDGKRRKFADALQLSPVQGNFGGARRRDPLDDSIDWSGSGPGGAGTIDGRSSGAARRFSFQDDGRGAAICRAAAVHLRLRGDDCFDHRDSRATPALESATCGRGGAAEYVSRARALLPRDADSGQCVSRAGCAVRMGTREEAHMNAVTARGKYQGVLQILDFNRPKYLAAAAAFSAAIAAWPFLAPMGRAAVLAGATPLVFWMVSSLVVSHYVYDCFPLYDLHWLSRALAHAPRRWINIHAGWDETSGLLARIFP